MKTAPFNTRNGTVQQKYNNKVQQTRRKVTLLPRHGRCTLYIELPKQHQKKGPINKISQVILGNLEDPPSKNGGLGY